MNLEEIYYQKQPVEIPPAPSDKTINRPLGELFGARSGDKGFSSNVGLIFYSQEVYVWAKTYVTEKLVKYH